MLTFLKLIKLFFYSLLLFIFFSQSFAQYQCDWNLISSGGKSVSDGNFFASVSICQTAVGVIQTGNYIGQIGFWVIDTAMVGIKEEELSPKLPLETELFPPLPNPFVRKTLIFYSLSKKVDVSIIIYNPCGQIVKQISLKNQKPGIYSFSFSPNKILKGVYFLRFKAGEYETTRKLIII